MTKEESTILKGIAIILMYIHHLFYLSDRVIGYDIQSLISTDALIGVGVYGKVCVTIFAFASGYGITKKYISCRGGKINWTKSILAEILRLQLSVAGVLVVALVVAEVLHTHTFSDVYLQEEGDVGILNLLIDVSGMASLCGKATYNGSWWYLKIAIWIMITIPLVNKIYDFIDGHIEWSENGAAEDTKNLVHMGSVGNLGGVLLLWIFYVSQILKLPQESFFSNLHLYGSYGIFIPCLGMLAARAGVFEKCKKGKNSTILMLPIIVVCIAFSYYGWHNFDPRGMWLTAVMMVGWCFLSITITKIPIVRSIFFILGKYSKYMFLCHSFVFSYFFQQHIYSFHWAGLILLMLVVYTVPLSVAFEWAESLVVKGIVKVYNSLYERNINS